MNSIYQPKDFVHLHVHSDYSLLQSAIQLKPLAKRLNELDMKACAITDYGNMYGAISFYNTMKAAEIQHPLIAQKMPRFQRKYAYNLYAYEGSSTQRI